jgi:hypothetical protein
MLRSSASCASWSNWSKLRPGSGVDADTVDPGSAELGHGIEIRSQRADVGTAQRHDSVAERD